MIRFASLAILAVAAACGRSDPSAATVAPPPLAATAAADLAHDIADADRLAAWSELPRRWQGQPVRWAVTYRRALCRSADDCYVTAFPIQRPAQQGWMPKLVFAPGQYERLVGGCGGADPCDTAVSGRIGKLEVSPELPTMVELAGVELASGPLAMRAHRDQAASDQWPASGADKLDTGDRHR